MAIHTVTLTAGQELALTAFTEAQQVKHPELTLSEDIVLGRIITGTLQQMDEEIETGLEKLRAVAHELPAVIRAKMVAGLTAAQQARLRHLLG